MACLQLLDGWETPFVCQVFQLGPSSIAWGKENVTGVIAILSCFTLFLTLWYNRHPPSSQVQATQSAAARAEVLLRESITPPQYRDLLNFGYIEIPSRLYPNRIYRIPRERRRVQVYELQEMQLGPQLQKLGELCVIACEPMPDADHLLTHKWLLEADEQRYLDTANWVRLS